MKKRIFLSVGMIVFVTAVVIGATGAFFSDTETSADNIFTAGAIDLQVDNTSYYNGAVSTSTTWTMRDLTIEKFFNFLDLKPGDTGEDTISLHVNNNDSWLCADVTLTSDNDNSLTEPESEDGDATGGIGEGELGDQVNFIWWADDGDNVLETDETVLPGGPIGALGVGNTATVALADSQTNIWGDEGPLPGASVRYVGKAWCFGDISAAALTQDGFGTSSPRTPANSTGGIACDGSDLDNTAQTDSLTADVSFRAVQSRNNGSFVCEAPDEEPVEPTVGALLSSYVAPTGESCNVVVSSSTPSLDTIQEGVDAALAGQTVCVLPGTYTGDVNVNKSITLAGGGSANTTVNGVGLGEAGALVISANNVTVKGFNVNGTGVSAIRISGARSGITINSNKMTSATGQNAFLADGGQTNHVLSNNEFVGSNAGPIAYVNGLASVNVASNNVDFNNNTFSGSGTMALGQEAFGSDVKLNKFSASTSFTDVEDWTAGSLFNQNNFNDAGLNLQHSENGNTGETGITNAENNWWGDANPADGDVNANADVDFNPFAASAFPQN